MTKEAPREASANIRYPVAERSGDLVWAVDLTGHTERPNDLTCVGCQGAMIFKKGTRRPHFAHKAAGTCTAGETVLHATTIRVLADALSFAISERIEYPMFWLCAACGAPNEGNLARLENATITIDRVWQDRVRPDLLITSQAGRPSFAIEVIVTHAPETETMDAYAGSGVPVVLIWPTWEWLNTLRTGLLIDDFGRPPGPIGRGHGYEVVGGPCRAARHPEENTEPSCPTCSQPTRAIALELVAGLVCYRCDAPVPVLDAIAYDSGTPTLLAASDPSLRGIEGPARERGVMLKENYSQTAGGRYRMHHCPKCRAKQGDFFVTTTGGGADRVDVTFPRTTFAVCGNGHWHQIAERPWGRGQRPRRFTAGDTGAMWGGAGTGPSTINDARSARSGHGSLTPAEAARRIAFGTHG